MTRSYRQLRLRRVGGVARVSGLTMVVLGALSLVLSALNPLSAEFAVSAAILALGLIEWRLGRRLASGDGSHVIRLVINQAGVAVVVTAYAVWQIVNTTDASVLALLERPEISAAFDLLDPLVRAEIDRSNTWTDPIDLPVDHPGRVVGLWRDVGLLLFSRKGGGPGLTTDKFVLLLPSGSG